MIEHGSVVGAASQLVRANPAAALRLLTPYLAREPDDPDALCVAAQAQLGLSEPEQALSSARRAGRLAPHDDWPLRLQTLALHQLGRDWDAQNLARHSVAANPGHWQTHYLVACADLWANAVTDHTVAAAAQARTLAPDEPSTHEIVGQVALAQGRTRQAVAAFEAALALDPEDAVAAHELARAQLRRFRIAKSVKGFLAVGRMDPTIRQTHLNLRHLAVRATLVLHYAVFGALLLSRPQPVLAAILLTAFATVVLGWTRLRGGPALYRFARGLWRTDRLLVSWAGLASGAGLLLIIRPVLSIGHRQTGNPLPQQNLLDLALLMLLAGVVISWVRRNRVRAD